MVRGSTHVRTFMLGMVAAAVSLVAPTALAATPTYYNDAAAFNNDITSSVTDDYSNPGYVFIQSNAIMSGVIGETDYMTTGFNDLNIVGNAPQDPRYCAGCNGSFELSFQTTSVGNAMGVNGVGMMIETNSNQLPYFAFITFADGTTDEVQLPGPGNFWGVAAPERVERIHFGLTMGGTTTNGSFQIDDLIVGDGNVGACMVDGDCVADGDPCTDVACIDGMCAYPFNTAPCDDGEICTDMDVCDQGICSGAPALCDDGNECTTDLCDPGNGCIIQLNNDPCDDGDVCTEMDVCDMGICGGTPLDCNDGDVCSMDSCDADLGCMSEPTMGCCTGDEDCAVDEMCDLGVNECVPMPPGSTGDTGSDATTTGTPPATSDTGVDSTAANDDTGVGVTGNIGTGAVDTGPGGTTGLSAGGEGDSGFPDPPDTGCNCKTTPQPQDRQWWLLAVFGLVAARRRRRAA